MRITYSKSKSAGQWRAHGQYIQRESATRFVKGKGAGFNATSDSIDIPPLLNAWQLEGDQRLWKMIVSPEFGEQLDLIQHTRELMRRMEVDLNTRLEWVAVVHYNTDHPHVHIAVRGRTGRCQPLDLPRDYIRAGVRQHAQIIATNQLGYRTPDQVLQAQNKEVHYQRRTSLDDLIAKQQKPQDAVYSRIEAPLPLLPALFDNAQEHRARLIHARLRALSKMGLATRIGISAWQVRTDFRETLKGMQRAQDRQKILATHGVLSSDERLQVEMLDRRNLRRVEGRVLVHDEEQESLRPYMLLEGTDGKIYLIYHDEAIEDQRAQNKLKPGHFVTLQKQFVDKRPRLEIEDLGDAHAVLSNHELLQRAARWRIRQGLSSEPGGWKGWLGQYQSALNDAVKADRERSSSIENAIKICHDGSADCAPKEKHEPPKATPQNK